MSAPVTAYEGLLGNVRGLIATRDLADPSDREIRAIAENELERFQRSSMIGDTSYDPFPAPQEILDRLVRDIGSIGAEIETLAADPTVEEIYGFNGEISYRTVNGRIRGLAAPIPPQVMRSAVDRLLTRAGEAVSAEKPGVDGVQVRLPDGRAGRLTVAIPPRIEGTIDFTLRIPQKRNVTLDDLVAWGSLTAPAANLLKVLMQVHGIKVLVAGPPNAGKTSLLDALLRAVPAKTRTIVLEEQRELTAPLPSGLYWASSKVEPLEVLIRSARVASPSLLVLGEMKGIEAAGLVQLGNLGTGLMAAVHSNSAAEAFSALATAAHPATPAMTHAAVQDQFVRIFDLVIYTDIETVYTDDAGLDGLDVRQVTQIAAVPPQISAGQVAVDPIFERTEIGEPLELVSPGALGDYLTRRCDRILQRHRLSTKAILDGAEVLL